MEHIDAESQTTRYGSIQMPKNVSIPKYQLLDDISTPRLLLNDFELHYFKLGNSAKTVLQHSWPKLYLFLFLDWLLCQLVIGPLGLAYWRGIWTITDYILDQIICGGSLVGGNILSSSLGLMGVVVGDLCHHRIKSAAGKPGAARHVFISRVFSVVWGLSNVLMWQGVWDGLNGLDSMYVLFTLPVSVAVLTLTGTCRTAISFPIGTSVDHPAHHISSNTLLDTKRDEPLIYRLFDSILSRCIEFAVIGVWQGLWMLQTMYLSPVCLRITMMDSILLSLSLGCIGNLLVFLLQFPMLRLCSNNKPGAIVLAANWVYCQLATLSTVSCFRSGWILMDTFYLPDNPVASDVTCFMIGLGGLMLLSCSSTIHPGVAKDNSIQTTGVAIPFYYISYFYIEEVAMDFE